MLTNKLSNFSCCWYHKGTNFQANHNCFSYHAPATLCCCWYHKGTNFQANHNTILQLAFKLLVVADTTKVRIFKQITTKYKYKRNILKLLLIPQRYEFSSKSQHISKREWWRACCCWYHKGTNFQANHNPLLILVKAKMVVADTTKVRIFKQITTAILRCFRQCWLLLIPQRYEFSSKSQPLNQRTA